MSVDHEIHTERLRLREFLVADLDELAAMVAHPDQMRFFPRPKTRAEAEMWLERTMALPERHGFGVWALEWRDVPGLVGYCGLRPVELDGAREVEVLWHVHRRWWGHGVATEAGAAAIRSGRTAHGLFRIVAMVVPDHMASRRVAARLGMRVERESFFDGDPVVIYVDGARSPEPPSSEPSGDAHDR
jgi:RimJ/RimL family protein N-acetyltransferase